MDPPYVSVDPNGLDIRPVQDTISKDSEPFGWKELRIHLTNAQVGRARQQVPRYRDVSRALEKIYAPGIYQPTREGLSSATTLLVQVERFINHSLIEVAFGLPLRLSSGLPGPLYCPTIVYGYKLKEQPGDGGDLANEASLWKESVFGIINPIQSCPQLVLPFLAVTITNELADGDIKKVLRQSMCYGACMIANMLEAKAILRPFPSNMPAEVEDNGRIRALTLTVTNHRIILVVHWAVESDAAAPAYHSRIANVWETNTGDSTPVQDAIVSVDLMMQWIIGWNLAQYQEIIQKTYGFYQSRCCQCGHQQLSQGPCRACTHESCIYCPVTWREPNY